MYRKTKLKCKSSFQPAAKKKSSTKTKKKTKESLLSSSQTNNQSTNPLTSKNHQNSHNRFILKNRTKRKLQNPLKNYGNFLITFKFLEENEKQNSQPWNFHNKLEKRKTKFLHHFN